MKQVIAQDGQSFLDLCFQTTGTKETLFDFCDANDVHPDDLPIPGAVYKVPDSVFTKPELVSQITIRDIVPNTLKGGPGADDVPPDDAPEGINYWGIEDDFIVQPD